MKYAIIAAVVALAFIVIYSRLRPYLKLIRKIVTSLNIQTNVGAGSATGRQVENKLVRCSGCGAWTPVDRAINLRRGTTSYCSSECLERSAETRDRKIVG